MREHDGHVHLDEEEASGGSKEGVVRWVLLGGLLLAVILMSVVWIIPALTKNNMAQEPTVSSQVQAEENEGNATDSILGTDGEPAEGAEVERQDGIEVIEN